MTEAENKTILRGWIARDENGELNLFMSKPKRHHIFGGCWLDDTAIPLSDSAFPAVNWQSEPLQVRLLLIPTSSELL